MTDYWCDTIGVKHDGSNYIMVVDDSFFPFSSYLHMAVSKPVCLYS